MNIKFSHVNKRREVLPSTDKPTVFSDQIHIVSDRKLLSNRGFPFGFPAPHPSPPRSPPPNPFPKPAFPQPKAPTPPKAPPATTPHTTAAEQPHTPQNPAPSPKPNPSPNNPAPAPAAAAPSQGPSSSGPDVNNDNRNSPSQSKSGSSGLVANPATGSITGTHSPDSVSPSYIPVQTLGPSSSDNSTTSSATQLTTQSAALSPGAIAGIVIGTLLLVGLVAFALYRALIVKKKQQGKEEDNFERDATPMSHLVTPTAFANYPSSVSMIHSQEQEQSPFHDSNTLAFPVPPPARTLNSSRVALVGHGGSSSNGGHGAASSYGGHGTATGTGSSFSSHDPAVSFSTGRATEGSGGGRVEQPPPPLPRRADATSSDNNHSDDVVYANPFHADDAESTEGHSDAPHTSDTLHFKSSDPSRYRTVGTGRRTKSGVSNKSVVSSVDRSSSVVDPFHADDALSARVIEGERVTLHLSGADATRYKEMSLARSMTIANHQSNFSSLPPE